MNKILILSCLVLAPSIASAADMVVYSPPLAAEVLPVNTPIDPPSWEGGYIGINAGWVKGEFDHPIRQYLKGKVGNYLYDHRESSDSSDSSYSLGAQIGYNWLLGTNFVGGFEADFQKTDLSGISGYEWDDYPDTEISINTKVDWFGTVRARIGYTPIQNILLYATGGFAYGKVHSDFEVIKPRISETQYSDSEVSSGWTAGAGAEYAINKNWNLKLEYLYIDLGKKTLLVDLINSGDEGLFIDRKVKLQTVRVGLNYKF